MAAPKFKGYQQAIAKVTLCDGIEDIEPYHITLPDPPKPEDIIGYGKAIEDQYFQPITLPKELWDMERLVKNEKDKSAAYKALEVNKELSQFVSDALDAMESGQWQYIRGIPIFIPGNYLKYLSFNKIKSKLPEFRIWDLHKIYWWNYCIVANPVVYGGIEMTRRQVGKTYIATFLAHNTALSSKSAIVGIQSKTEDDAWDAFDRGVLLPRKYYPFWLRGSSSTELMSKGSKVALDHPDHDGTPALESSVSYKSSEAHAYDGSNLLMYVNDECGKNTNEDVAYLLSVIRPLLHTDSEITGKALFTSTVEEQDRRGGKNFKNLWIDSDRQLYADESKRKVDYNGQTTSGLIPYFTPSYANYLKDDYGFSIIDEPLPHQYESLLASYKKRGFVNPEKEARKGARQLIDERINRQKTEAKKQEEIRKYPRNIKEAFRSSAVGCLYDVTKINSRLDDFIHGNGHLVTYGKHQWKDGIRFGEVEFVPTSKTEARVETSLLPQQYANKSVDSYGGRMPANTHLFTAGADCFRYNQVKDVARSSKGAGLVYAGFNEAFDDITKDPKTWVTSDFVCQYFFRYENMPTEEFAEDILMMCIFYGCQCAPESNIRVVQDFFVKHGFTNYLMFPEKLIVKKGDVRIESTPHAGFYTGGDESKIPMVNAMSKYVSSTAMRCKFPELLEQLRDMTYEDFNPYDLFIAASGAYRYYYQVLEKQSKKEETGIDLMDFMTRY